MPVLTPNIPDGLTDLMKSLAKGVLREKPENVNEFAAEFFEKLLLERDGTADKNYKTLTLYEKYLEGRSKYDITYSKKFVCHCNEEKRINQVQIVQSKKSKNIHLQRQKSVKNSETLMSIQEEPKEPTNHEFDDHHINATYVIQKYIRKYLSKKRNLKKSESNETSLITLTEEKAAIIIQRTIRRIYLKNLTAPTETETETKNSKIENENPATNNLAIEQPEKEQEENLSEVDSYTSSSTIQLMSNTPEANDAPIKFIKEQSIGCDLEVESPNICNESEESIELSHTTNDNGENENSGKPPTENEYLNGIDQLTKMEEIPDHLEEDGKNGNFVMIPSIGKNSLNFNTTTEVNGGDILESTSHNHNKNAFKNLENGENLNKTTIKKSQLNTHLRQKRSVPRSHNMDKFQPKIISDGETYEYFEISADGMSLTTDNETNNLKNYDESDKDDFEYPDSLNNSYAEKDSLECDHKDNYDEQELDSIDESTAILNMAALKIQKVFRGYLIRKTINEHNNKQQQTDINNLKAHVSAYENTIDPGHKINKNTLIVTQDNEQNVTESDKNEVSADTKMYHENEQNSKSCKFDFENSKEEKYNYAAKVIQEVYRMHLIQKSFKLKKTSSLHLTSMNTTLEMDTLPSIESSKENGSATLNEIDVKSEYKSDINEKFSNSTQFNDSEIVLEKELNDNIEDYSFNFTEEPIIIGQNDDKPLEQENKISIKNEITTSDCDVDDLKKATWFVGDELITPTVESNAAVDNSHLNSVNQESSLSRALRLTPNLKSFSDNICSDYFNQNSQTEFFEDVICSSKDEKTTRRLTIENGLKSNDEINENVLTTKNSVFNNDVSIKSSIDQNHFLHEQLLGDTKMIAGIETTNSLTDKHLKLDKCESVEVALAYSKNQRINLDDDKNVDQSTVLILNEINQTVKNKENLKSDNNAKSGKETKVANPQAVEISKENVELKNFNDALSIVVENDSTKVSSIDQIESKNRNSYINISTTPAKEEKQILTDIKTIECSNQENLRTSDKENKIHLPTELIVNSNKAEASEIEIDLNVNSDRTYISSSKIRNSNETLSDKEQDLLETGNDGEQRTEQNPNNKNKFLSNLEFDSFNNNKIQESFYSNHDENSKERTESTDYDLAEVKNISEDLTTLSENDSDDINYLSKKLTAEKLTANEIHNTSTLPKNEITKAISDENDLEKRDLDKNEIAAEIINNDSINEVLHEKRDIKINIGNYSLSNGEEVMSPTKSFKLMKANKDVHQLHRNYPYTSIKENISENATKVIHNEPKVDRSKSVLEDSITKKAINGSLNSSSPNSSVEASEDILKSSENDSHFNSVYTSTVVSTSSLIATPIKNDRTEDNTNENSETVSAKEKEENKQKSLEISEESLVVNNDNIEAEKTEGNIKVLKEFKNEFNKTFIKDTDIISNEANNSEEIEKSESENFLTEAINNIAEIKESEESRSNNEIVENDTDKSVNSEVLNNKDYHNEKEFKENHLKTNESSEVPMDEPIIVENNNTLKKDKQVEDSILNSYNGENIYNSKNLIDGEQLLKNSEKSENEHVEMKTCNVLVLNDQEKDNETELNTNRSNISDHEANIIDVDTNQETINKSQGNINQSDLSKEIHDVLKDAKDTVEFLESQPNETNLDTTINEGEEDCQKEIFVNENSIEKTNMELSTNSSDLMKGNELDLKASLEQLNESILSSETQISEDDKAKIDNIDQESDAIVLLKDETLALESNDGSKVEISEMLNEQQINDCSEVLPETVETNESNINHHSINENESGPDCTVEEKMLIDSVRNDTISINKLTDNNISDGALHVLLKQELNESKVVKPLEKQLEADETRPFEEHAQNNNSLSNEQTKEPNRFNYEEVLVASLDEKNEATIIGDVPSGEMVLELTHKDQYKDNKKGTEPHANLDETTTEQSTNDDFAKTDSISFTKLNNNSSKEMDEEVNTQQPVMISGDCIDNTRNLVRAASSISIDQEKDSNLMKKEDSKDQSNEDIPESKENADYVTKETTKNGTSSNSVDQENILLGAQETNSSRDSFEENQEMISEIEEKFNLSAGLENNEKFEDTTSINTENEEQDKLIENRDEYKISCLSAERIMSSDDKDIEETIKYEKKEVQEEPCLKKSVSLSHLPLTQTTPTTSIYEDLSEIERIDISKYSADSLEGMYYSLRKNELMLDRMQRRASEHMAPSKKNELSKAFDINPCKTIKSLNMEDSTDTDDDLVLKELQKEACTRENIIEGKQNTDERSLKNNDSEIMKQCKTKVYQKMHTIGGENNFKMNSDSEEDIREAVFLDESTALNIRKNMLAYSISEEDSENCEMPEQKTNALHDDFNISTALLEPIVSTDTDSTIISAATKIQAGARGFITRRRLRRASDGTKASLSDLKASFGNGAISESLENLVEEESAKKIQKKYRQYRKNKELNQNSLPDVKIMHTNEFQNTSNENNTSNDDADDRLAEIINEHSQKNNDDDDNEKRIISKNATNTSEYNEDEKQLEPPINFDGTLAARRMTLHRGDAVQKDSIRDEENSHSSSSSDKRAENILTTRANTAKSSDAEKFRRLKKFQMLGIRQNSMPVQIDSEVLRVIPKHLRKRIKSADGQKKRRTNLMQ